MPRRYARARLVDDLVWNHASFALGIDGAPNALKNPPPPTRRRVIVVLGAGASHALNGVPLARDAATAIEAALGFDVPEVSRIFQVQLDDLVRSHPLSPEDFETRLLAASRLDRSGTMRELQNVFNVKYSPTLGHELLAHMLKHRFIDGVINFNFDELFDEALRGESRDADYYRVVSGEDCPGEKAWIEGENRLDRPALVKPHGTIRREETLRFTPEAYLNLPSSLRTFLKTFLSRTPVTLWIVGFCMKSPDINTLIREIGEESPEWARESRICYTLKTDYPRRALPSFPNIECLHFPVTETDDLNGTVGSVWRAAEARHKRYLFPRGKSRHALLATVFSATPSNGHYRERTIVELALSVAKAKGWVSLPEMAMGRPGFYFKRAKENRQMSGSLLDVCEEMGLSSTSYSPVSLRLDAEAGVWDWRELSTVPEEVGIPRLMEFLSAQLPRLRHPSEVRDRVEHLLVRVWRGREVEISPEGSRQLECLFPDARVIRTYTEFTWRSHQLLSEGWDVLLCVAETGEWLLRLPQELEAAIGDRTLALVVADAGLKGRLLGTFGCQDESIRQMPWWGHNVHLTLALKTAPRVHAVGGIMFSRRLRSPRIAPLFLPGDSGHRIISTFAAYWAKAHPEGLYRFIGPTELQEARREIETLFFAGRVLPSSA